MANETRETLRAELVAALAANTERLREALRTELARPIRLAPRRYLQFEVDPFFYGIHCCETEEVLIKGDWLNTALSDAWFEQADRVLDGWHGMIQDELCPWFADCWQAVGGPGQFSPAYLFFHGYHLDMYDLGARRWIKAAEAFRQTGRLE